MNYNLKGWLRDKPDFRDYSMSHPEVKEILPNVTMMFKSSVSLLNYCSEVGDQGQLGSCTAWGVSSLIEYFENKVHGKHLDVSKLFVYKATRNLVGLTGDSGAEIRNAIGAVVLFGAPPEKFWKYNIKYFDIEPLSFCYSFAQNYKTLKYVKLDTPSTPKQDLLNRIKYNLCLELPSVFGFTCYSSLDDVEKDGYIPFPSKKEMIEGGHCVSCFGYDDDIVIVNKRDPNIETVGALLIKNSWGRSWGNSGYGWLPYEYVLKGLAVDWWIILDQGFVDIGQFGL